MIFHEEHMRTERWWLLRRRRRSPRNSRVARVSPPSWQRGAGLLQTRITRVMGHFCPSGLSPWPLAPSIFRTVKGDREEIAGRDRLVRIREASSCRVNLSTRSDKRGLRVIADRTLGYFDRATRNNGKPMISARDLIAARASRPIVAV